jgi:hypothetical protein
LSDTCNVIRQTAEEDNLTTTAFKIIQINDKVNVYQSRDSKGNIKTETDYRVVQGFQYFRIK